MSLRPSSQHVSEDVLTTFDMFDRIFEARQKNFPTLYLSDHVPPSSWDNCSPCEDVEEVSLVDKRLDGLLAQEQIIVFLERPEDGEAFFLERAPFELVLRDLAAGKRQRRMPLPG